MNEQPAWQEVECRADDAEVEIVLLWGELWV